MGISYDACGVCDWVYLDKWYLGINDAHNPTFITLREGQRNFAQTGMCNERVSSSRLKSRVRPYERDPLWKPLPVPGEAPDWVVPKDLDIRADLDTLANNFNCLGLPITSVAAFEGFMEFAAYAGEPQQLSDGFNIRWSPGEGIEAWVQAWLDRRLSGCRPHYRGTGRVRARIDRIDSRQFRIDSGQYSLLDGSAVGWLLEEGASAEVCPLCVDLPEAAIGSPNLSPPACVDLQVAAFAHDIQCFSTFEQMRSSGGTYAGLAAPAFVSATAHEEHSDLPAGSPKAVLVGTVRAYEQKTNPLTYEQFHTVSVASLGGTIDVVATLEAMPEPPRVGGILAGTFYLSARIVAPSP